MALDKKTEALIQKYVKLLDCTREEALDIIEQDKAIDKGEATEFDLDEEHAKVAKKMTKMGVKKAPMVPKLDATGKKHKENPTKQAIIAGIAKFLEENSENSCESVEITNKERMIAFKIGEDAFELTLVQKRKPKK